MPISKDATDERFRNSVTDYSSIGRQESTVASRSSKYGVNVVQYPSDLGAEHLLHYIEFSINVRGKSEFNKDNRRFEVKRNPDAAGFTESELSTAATVSTGLATGVITTGLTRNILDRIGRTGSRSRSRTVLGSRAAADTVLSTAAGVVTGLTAGAAVNASDLLKPDTTYRISDVIALYVDNPPSVKYGMQYNNKELGTLAGVLSGSALDTKNSLFGAGEIAAAFGATLAKLPGAFGTVNVQSALSASSKTSLNPFKEVIFESVDFRTFMFKYRFMPKDKAESEAVKNIVKLFKFHMHPEMSPGKLFFIYPSEFQITYFYGTSSNKYFHKMAPCVLTSMDVTYGGEQVSSFDDGNPTEVYMNLTFQETEILTKKMIEGGY